MSRASNLAKAIGADGTLNVSDVAGLAAVASSGSASDLSTGTLPIARIADGAVTYAKLSTGAPVWDSNGRIGVNATPNTNWPTSWSVGEWQGGNAVWGVQGQFQMGYNNYYDGTNYRFKATGNRALRYIQTDSGHYWDTSASGTANAAATFETQMQLGHQQTLALRGASPQSGTGITFPAAQSASSDANTLDDYREGSWTPNWRTTNGGAITVSDSYAYYVKVGRIVYIKLGWYAATTSASSWSGVLRFDLPFAAYVPSGGRRDVTATIPSIAVFTDTTARDAFFIVDSSSYADCYTQNGRDWNNVAYYGNNASATTYIHVSLTYESNT